MFTISIVSHGQMGLVRDLLDDLRPYFQKYRFEVILTLNIPEKIDFKLSSYPFDIRVIENLKKLGFGKNHNQAFAKANFDRFCILNPDIRLPVDPFYELLDQINTNQDAIVGPLVLSRDHKVEDSARKYPTLLILIKRLLSRRILDLDYEMGQSVVSVDWIAGMFLMMTSKTFKRLGGFDQKYFMYYEDVDLCFRNKHAGFENCWITKIYVVHDARRQSRRNLRYMRWHIKSCILFMIKRLLNVF